MSLQKPMLFSLHGASRKFSATVRFFPSPSYHNWCTCNQPQACQILVGDVPCILLHLLLSTHISKEWISLPSCHFGYFSYQKTRSQSSQSWHLKSYFCVLWTSSEQKAMWRNLRPALLKSPCLLTKMIYLNSCTIILPIIDGMCFICNLQSLISAT